MRMSKARGLAIQAVLVACAAVLVAAPTASSSALATPLVVKIEGHGSVTGPGIDCHTGNTGTCTGSYTEDTTVNFTATPDPGWAFAHWDGECARTTNVCDVYMGSDAYLTAIFVPSGLKLRVGVAIVTRAVAGRPFTLTLPVTRSDTGKAPTTARVTCAARAAAKPVPARGSLLRGRAVCSLRIPSSAKGAGLSVRITVRVDGTSVTRTFAARIA